MRWEAVKGFFRVGDDGNLEFNPDSLPEDLRRRPAPPDDPEAAARAADDAKRRETLNRDVNARTSAMADKIAKDFQVQRKLEDELKAEPGGDLILAHARTVMDGVPVERRSEQAWRNAVLLGRGATESKRREHWLGEGSRKAMEDLEKVHKIRIPKPVQIQKTEEQMVDELTDEQKAYCRRTGMDQKRYALRLAELQGHRTGGQK